MKISIPFKYFLHWKYILFLSSSWIPSTEKKKSCQEPCHHWWCFALFTGLFVCCIFSQRGKKLLVLIIKLVILSQRTDGKYLYKYVDAFGNTKYVYAWRLTPTDPTPKGKREKPSLRELEQQIRRYIEDGIDSTGKKMTLCQLYAKQNAQRANVKKSTQKQREQLMRLLKEDKLGC